jgi:trigger factor
VKTVIEKLTPTRSKLTINVSPEELKPMIEHAYEHIAEQVNIPGFRKGKVPAPIIDTKVGRPAVLEHAVQEGLEGYYRQAVTENKVRPMGRPEVDILEWPNPVDFGGDLIISIEVPTRPDVKLPAYDSIAVKIDAAKVSADDIADELDRLRSRFGTLVSVDRPAKKGDFLTINLDATIAGNKVDTAESISYELGSGELIAGIDDALDTLTAGEETTFESVLLGGDHEGEKAQIAVKVLAVKERELPKADDDFAQIASEYDTIAELKDSLKNEVETRKKGEQGVAARKAILDYLIEKVKFDLPEGIVDEEVHRHLEGEGRLEDDVHRAEVIEESTTMFRQQILLDTIAEAEEIQVGEDEVMQYLFQGAVQYGMEPGEFARILQENGQLPQVYADIARNKALTIVLSQAKVTDSAGKAVEFPLEVPAEEKAEKPAKKVAAAKKPAAEKPAAEKKPAAKKPAAKKD